MQSNYTSGLQAIASIAPTTIVSTQSIFKIFLDRFSLFNVSRIRWTTVL